MAKDIKLSNGVSMPLFGLGTWQAEPAEVREAVRTALDAGYRLIDTAAAYRNEQDIGDVLKEYFAAGKLRREDVFVTTKLFWAYNRAEDVEEQLRASLKQLGLDYVDLYLIHMPTALKKDMSGFDPIKVEDIWKGMEDVYNKKLTRSVGVSNFSIEQIERIRKIARVPVHNTQVELHLHFNQRELRDYCAKHNISVTAYAPIGSPGRKDIVLPNGSGVFFTPSPSVLENAVVLSLAKKYNKTPAQILLRHLIQHNISVIPKSTNEKRLKENSQVFDFNLAKDEIDQLDKVPQHQRLFLLDFMKGHPEDALVKER